MSYYPAGMRESDIPGWDDRDVEIYARCDAEDVEVRVANLDNAIIIASWIKQLIQDEINGVEPPKGYGPNLKRAIEKVDQIQTVLRYRTTGVVDFCPFEGDVEALYGGGVVSWKCPICETEHEDNASDYYD